MNRMMKFAALAVVAAAGLLSSSASASVTLAPFTYPLTIPTTIDGLFINITTGTTSTASTEPAGFDLNPYSITAGQSFWTSTNSGAVAGRGYVTTTGGLAQNFAATGGVVDAASVYGTGAVNAATTFPAGTTGTVGFRFFKEDTATLHYGYMTLVASSGSAAPTTPGSVLAIYYESTPNTAITVPAVPEPTSLALLSLGGLAALRRRRA